MLRNSMFSTGQRFPNLDVGVVINGAYIEIEGMNLDPAIGRIVLQLDQEALTKALARGPREQDG